MRDRVRRGSVEHAARKHAPLSGGARGLAAMMVLAGIAGCGPLETMTVEGLAPTAGEEVPAVEYRRCHAEGGIRICIDRETYGRSERLPYSITNDGDERAYENRCTGSVEGRPSESEAWSGSFGYRRSCANWPDEDDIREHMELLEPGEPVVGTLAVGSVAHDGQWRAVLDILDRNAEPLGTFSSPLFQVIDD